MIDTPNQPELIEMMGAEPPDDPDQREAYFEVFQRKLFETYPDTAMAWTLLAHSGSLWQEFQQVTNELARKRKQSTENE